MAKWKAEAWIYVFQKYPAGATELWRSSKSVTLIQMIKGLKKLEQSWPMQQDENDEFMNQGLAFTTQKWEKYSEFVSTFSAEFASTIFFENFRR